MIIIFTRHAVDRMKERGASKEMVMQTINKPDRKEPKYINQEEFTKKFKTAQNIGKELSVIFRIERRRRIVVITVYWKI